MFRSANPTEYDHLIKLADQTGIFKPGEAATLLGGVLEDFHNQTLGPGHEIVVSSDLSSREAVGWVYFAPSAVAEGVWDLWWIGVNPARYKAGHGSNLLTEVERRVREAGGRLLIIETSSTHPLAPARKLYAKLGYLNCGLIPDFYGEGDDKITFAKKMGLQPIPSQETS